MSPEMAVSLRGGALFEPLEPRLLLSTGEISSYWNGAVVNIPDNGGSSGAWGRVSLNVSGAPSNAVITSVDVYYEIKHTYVSDVKAWLTTDYGGDNWQDYVVWNREGGAGQNIAEWETGIHRWDNAAANRTWWLVAGDYASSDTGYLDFFEVHTHWYAPDPDQAPTLTLTGPASNVTVTQGQTVNITWTDSDPDDNAFIALARDPDTGSTPWIGTNNHTWLTGSLTEDPDGVGDQYAWDTSGVDPGTYSVWGMIYDGTNPEVYSRAPGLITIEISTTQTYMLPENGGVSWVDAEKELPNSPTEPGTGDDFLCWAAAASNILTWTGWGDVAGVNRNEDLTLDCFEGHWTDRGSFAEYGVDWWFDGTGEQPFEGSSSVDPPGGGFYPALHVSNYMFVDNRWTSEQFAEAMPEVAAHLKGGRAVAIGLYQLGLLHTVTVWGFDYNPADPAYFTGIWLTNSDDNKDTPNSSSAPNYLLHYSLLWNTTESRWFLWDGERYRDGVGTPEPEARLRGGMIRTVCALSPRPTGVVEAPVAPSWVSATESLTDRVHIAWASSARAISYDLYRGEGSDFSSAGVLATDLSQTEYDDIGAAPGVTYHYWVKARNGSGSRGVSPSDSGSVDVNDPPTEIFLSNAVVIENQPADTTVGWLTTLDPDAGDSWTYSLLEGADSDLFTISDNTLQTALPLDYETEKALTVSIQTRDSGGLTYEKTFTIAVADEVGVIQVGHDEWGCTVLNVVVVANYAYVCRGHELGILGLCDDPAWPFEVGSVSLPSAAQSVAVSGNLAYVADNYAGLQIIDVSNPADPVWLGGYDTSDIAYGVSVSGNLAYVADNYAGLQIIDVSNPAAPVRLGGYDTGGQARAVFVSGNLAYVADNSAGLQIIDVSNPADPVWLGGYHTSDYARGVFVSGNLAYVADYEFGLQIIDVSNPADPVWLGEYETRGLAYGVFVSGNLAYVADSYAGLQIIDVSDPADPVRMGGYDTSGQARAVFVSGNLAYVADEYGGLVIIEVVPGPAPSVTVVPSATPRSCIEEVRFVFSEAVSGPVSALRLHNDTTGADIDLSAATLDGSSTHVLTWDLYAVALPDGLYTGRLLAASVVDAHGNPLDGNGDGTPGGDFVFTFVAGITLSNAAVPENQPVGTTVGTFSTTDPETGNGFTYALVSGAGSTHNSSFTIAGNVLKTAAVFNSKVKDRYNIRVRTTDDSGLWFEKAITIFVAMEWTGAVDDHWENAANWWAGVVPGTQSLVRISAAARQPVMEQDETVWGLDLAAGGTLTFAPGTPKTLVTKGLTIAESGGVPTARLDLASGRLIVDYDDGTASPLADVRRWLAAGCAGMTWTGSGITSSAAAGNPNTCGVGYAQNDMLVAPYDVFSGVPVDSSTVLVKYTYLGDVNLDGKVDDNDVTIMVLNYGIGWKPGKPAGPADWQMGDVARYDGKVDDNDVTLVVLNYGAGWIPGKGAPLGDAPGAAALPAAAPEVLMTPDAIPSAPLVEDADLLVYAQAARTRQTALGSAQAAGGADVAPTMALAQSGPCEGSAFSPVSGTSAADDPPLALLAAASTPLAWSTAEEAAPTPDALLSPDGGIEDLLGLPALVL
jgi:hypothetical protein